MGFYACNFIYNGTPASQYGLRISSLSEQGESVGASVELITQSVYRKSRTYLLGVKHAPVLSIPITITVETELNATESSAISRWLFGNNTYNKLQIIQPDMENVYYNCIFQNPSLIKIGNITRGFTATAVCDSPFAWYYPKRENFEFNDYSVYEKVTINNISDIDDYVYPTLEVKVNMFGGSFEIINTSDKSRIFGLSNLKPNASIVINNDTQEASSPYTSENYLESMRHYHYKWFRYAPGANNLIIKGNIEYLSFINHFPKKIS